MKNNTYSVHQTISMHTIIFCDTPEQCIFMAELGLVGKGFEYDT